MPFETRHPAFVEPHRLEQRKDVPHVGIVALIPDSFDLAHD
jgi:hypothetical protein